MMRNAFVNAVIRNVMIIKLKKKYTAAARL